MDKKTIKDIDVTGKKVLVRVDFNVPMDDNGVITDDKRIRASLDTIKYLMKKHAAVILMAHLGRPKGKTNAKYSLAVVAQRLSELLHKEVAFVDNCIGADAKEAAAQLESGDVLLLENLRFHTQEEANDMKFAEQLASLAEVYVNDGFGVSHRAHASVEGVTHFLPAVAGLLLEKEIKYLGKAVNNPVRPFAAIIGGAKVSDKIGVIDNLLDKVDSIFIGGGMANTFLAANGCKMGKSLVEKDKIKLAKKLIQKAEVKKVALYLPTDLVMASAFAEDATTEVDDIAKINQKYMALDIGPQTTKTYADAIKKMKTIVWNGPMGVFEMDAFCQGTEGVAKAVASAKGTTIVGGGDSVAAIEKLKLADKIDHISTGGGASLEYLEGKELPGIAALDDLRTPIVAGNWKMHKTVNEALDLAVDLVADTFGATSEVVIFPPFTALESVAAAVDGKEIGYGAQDLWYEDAGAFTGSVSGAMIADIGCQYVIVGHSERRTIFGENDTLIHKKMQAAYANKLIPMLCVGEDAKERQEDKTERKITNQIKSALYGLAAENVAGLIVAYEPLWAIGSGNTATPADAQAVCRIIRKCIEHLYDDDVASRVRILYGGSVKADNAASFHIEGIDGVLVGGASLDSKSFANIVRNF